MKEARKKQQPYRRVVLLIIFHRIWLSSFVMVKHILDNCNPWDYFYRLHLNICGPCNCFFSPLLYTIWMDFWWCNTYATWYHSIIHCIYLLQFMLDYTVVAIIYIFLNRIFYRPFLMFFFFKFYCLKLSFFVLFL